MEEYVDECVHGRRVDGRIGGRMCARTEGGWMFGGDSVTDETFENIF
jgi:hypothetical protein